ncbi:DUF421 domain-containing protein [Sinomonas sp. RB5]
MDMRWLTDVDWKDLLVPHTALLEIFLRGSLVYLCLYVLLRLVLRRQRGGVGVTDLLVIVLIADAAQNAMAGQYTSLPDGLLLVAVIIGWAAVLDWLGYRFPLVQKFLSPPPLVLYSKGKLNRRAMRSENITVDEIMQEVRLQGMTSLEEVELVALEGDGQMSIILKDQRARRQGKDLA